MKKLTWSVIFSLLLPTLTIADGDWTICWVDKVAGVSLMGGKTMCKKCYSRPGPPPRLSGTARCEYFRFQHEAIDWWAQNCDCP